MSGGLAPSKTTVYVSNLPFSLTNNDLHKIFEKYGKVVKVTILKDQNHRSKGVAFVLFLDRDGAHKCVRALNKTEMFGRTLKCSLAKDNGRAPEFIRKKVYPDKSRCYECGDTGHLSYKCPKNLLGEREPPKKKEKKRKSEQEEEENSDKEDEDIEGMESLAAAIKIQQEKMEQEYQYRLKLGEASTGLDNEPKRKKYKKDAYFSDEEEISD